MTRKKEYTLEELFTPEDIESMKLMRKHEDEDSKRYDDMVRSGRNISYSEYEEEYNS